MRSKSNLKKAMFIFLIILYSVELAKAETYTVSPTGSSDQKIINAAINAASPGDTVYLASGIYWVDATTILKSGVNLKGDPDAIIKVIPSKDQWYIGMTGIISSYGPIYDVIISDFQIDGSCDELDSGLSDSAPQYDHDAERAIIINGYTNQFCNNVIVRNMQIYDCFSDGVHVRFANNVWVHDNFISNCQHEGVFFTSIINGEICKNKIAGITSDCVRCDNCVQNRVYENVLFSYRGPNSNGAYQGGQNGVQIANAGASHGYDASNKPTTTTNVEVFDNVLANGMLNTIWVHSIDESQVYLHDNRLIDGTDLADMGIPLEWVNYTNTPTKEMSEKVFSTIFDIFNVTFTDTGRTNQTSDKIHYSVKKTENGIVAGGVKLFVKDKVVINNETYIPDNNSFIAKAEAVKAPSLDFNIFSVEKMDKNVSVKVDNGTATATLKVTTRYYKQSPNNKGSIKKSVVTFTESIPAPKVLERPDNIKGIIYQYPTYFAVSVPSNGLIKVHYEYKDNSSDHIYLVGERQTDKDGVEYTNFTELKHWEGNINHEGNFIKIFDEFDKSKLNVTVTTPYEEIEVKEFNITKKDFPAEPVSRWFYAEVVFLAYCVIFGVWLFKQIF